MEWSLSLVFVDILPQTCTLSIMKIPNHEHAVVDIAKIRDYCLNPDHSVGKHKAHVFKAVLNLTFEDAPMLRDILLKGVSQAEASIGEQDEYGQRYTVDILVTVGDKQTEVRSGWIVRADEDFPRLTTCFVL